MTKDFDLSEVSSRLQSTGNGVWTAQGGQGCVSYPSTGQDECYSIEESSFWFNHRNRCLLEVLKQFPPAGVVLDVGGANGYVTQALLGAGYRSILVEPLSSGVQNAIRRGIPQIVQATLEECDFRPGMVPGIGLFDVHEHISDDVGYLQYLRRMLMEEGRLYVTVPALNGLWSQEDRLAGHYRRYTR